MQSKKKTETGQKSVRLTYIEEETTIAISKKYSQHSSDPNIPLKNDDNFIFYF